MSSISARVDKARELLSTALQQQVDCCLLPHCTSSTTGASTISSSFYEHKQHHSDLLARRKCYYRQIKASKMLSRLAFDPSFRDVTAMNQQIPVGEVGICGDCNVDERITTVHIVTCDSLDRMNEEIVASASTSTAQPVEPPVTCTSIIELPTIIEPTIRDLLSDDQTYVDATENVASDIAMSHTSIKRLKMRGFYAIKELIDRNKSVLQNNVELRDPENRKTTNAAYCYDDTPFEGWRKEISVRMSGKSQGSLDIHYIAKSTKRRFRSQNEIARYLSQNNNNNNSNLPMIDISRFEFRSVFCVCHSTEDPSRSFLECSFGRTGCNRWMHPECVGLGCRTEHELKLLPRVTCPFCSAYLTDTGELSKLSSNQQPIM